MTRLVLCLACFVAAGCKFDRGDAQPPMAAARPPQPTAADAPTAPSLPVTPGVAPTRDEPKEPEPADAGFATSRGRWIQWKRSAALETDLMRALELTRDELCLELGSESCIRAVHTVALGGNDPFGSGLLRPAATSLSTTPLAVDRVALSACSRRARADRDGSPKVFTALDLSGPAPAPDAAAVATTITTLFQRLLARDPKPSEVATIAGLLSNDGERMPAEEFAALSCFVVASSLEFLFF